MNRNNNIILKSVHIIFFTYSAVFESFRELSAVYGWQSKAHTHTVSIVSPNRRFLVVFDLYIFLIIASVVLSKTFFFRPLVPLLLHLWDSSAFSTPDPTPFRIQFFHNSGPILGVFFFSILSKMNIIGKREREKKKYFASPLVEYECYQSSKWSCFLFAANGEKSNWSWWWESKIKIKWFNIRICSCVYDMIRTIILQQI